MVKILTKTIIFWMVYERIKKNKKTKNMILFYKKIYYYYNILIILKLKKLKFA